MKKTYITPKNACTELRMEGTIALSKNETLGDGWHTQKKSGWDAENWETISEDEDFE